MANDVVRFDVQVYDINGNERRPSLLRPFFADCGAVLFCYAVNSRDSLLKMNEWVSLLRQNIPVTAKEPSLFILGCKSDTPREIQIEDISLLTISTGASFLGECSCLKPPLVEEAFSRISLSVHLNKQFRRFKDEVLIK